MFARIVIVSVGVLFASCDANNANEEPQKGVESTQFSTCNSALSACSQGSGKYCLFGFKWGAENEFSLAGFDVEGPREAGGTVTYSFQNGSDALHTHRQVNVETKPFDDLPDCARDQIRRAMNDWAAVASVDFEEMPEGTDSNIRFFAADIFQSGIGYPNFSAGRCGTFSGNVILNPNSRYTTCELFYNFVLHEVGHALGLGHVDSDNVMNAQQLFEHEDGLRSGDIEGIQALYGERQ